MRTTLIALTVLFAVPALAQDKTAAELKAVVEKMNNAWSAGDVKGMRAQLADNVVAWDTDFAGRPAAWNKADDIAKMFQDSLAMMKSMGATMTMKATKIDCMASGDLGVCMQEGDMHMTMPKMPATTLAFRQTEVLKKDNTGWKITHHHGSLAKAPPMPEHFMALNAKNAQWQDAPGMPGGMKMATIWMDPSTMKMAGLMKVGAEGMKQARHMHPYGATITVLEGGITTSDASGKDTEVGPGTVIYRAAKEPHTTSMKPNTVALIVTDGPFDSVMVDAKGNPTPAGAK